MKIPANVANELEYMGSDEPPVIMLRIAGELLNNYVLILRFLIQYQVLKLVSICLLVAFLCS